MRLFGKHIFDNRMTIKSIKFLTLTLLLFLVSRSVKAQDEFHAEIGPVFGSSIYMGDAQSSYPKHAEVTYGLLFRYKFDERWALKAEWNMTKASGIYTKQFRNDVTVLDISGEFNFFDYAYSSYKRSSRRYSPYILAGVGGMGYSYESSYTVNPSVLFGAGFKVKLSKRLNLSAQYANKILLADNIEGVSILNDEARLNGTNFLNNDMLSSFTVAITFDIWEKNCNCITKK